MKFRTTFQLTESDKKIAYGDEIICLGSCFSNNIGDKLVYYGWKVLNNPFGTIFHPLAIARLISASIENDFSFRVCEKDTLFYAYETHSSIAGKTMAELEENYKQQLTFLNQQLSRSKWMFITFGSAWGYTLNDQVIANCHKQPHHQFEKRLYDVSELVAEWKQLLAYLNRLYPQLNIVFTVSPVRHKKDGMIENQRSKSRLIELVHALSSNYFPAYELLLDDLRDYRFYGEDMLHPNALAIDYIFEKFTETFISREAAHLFTGITRIRKMEAHRPHNDVSSSKSDFLNQKNLFLAKHPFVNW